MKRFKFTLTGLTPLLIHADNVMGADALQGWRKDPMNKNRSVPGDDRSPAWTWKTYLYEDGKQLTVPADNLMVALRLAGAEVTMAGRKSFKAATQTGLLIDQLDLPLFGPKGVVPLGEIEAIDNDAPFEEHREAVKPLGFELFVKRAKIVNAKHVRVRPRFETWSTEGTIQVSGAEFTLDKLRMIFDIAGMSKGLCDWRPSSPKSPGPFGRFRCEITPVSERKQAA